MVKLYRYDKGLYELYFGCFLYDDSKCSDSYVVIWCWVTTEVRLEFIESEWENGGNIHALMGKKPHEYHGVRICACHKKQTRITFINIP
jgi:hypothetical protein